MQKRSSKGLPTGFAGSPDAWEACPYEQYWFYNGIWISGPSTDHLTAGGWGDLMTETFSQPCGLSVTRLRKQSTGRSLKGRVLGCAAVWWCVSSLITSWWLSISEAKQHRTASWTLAKRQDFVTVSLKKPPVCRLSTTPARKRGEDC